MYKNGVNYEFRWNGWNIEHIAEHDVNPVEAEYVVNHARAPWPEKLANDKWRVWGQTNDGRCLQVVYVFDPDATVFVIHARELSKVEKRRFRRRRR
jgi:uncharacterized DUF497 family protein